MSEQILENQAARYPLAELREAQGYEPDDVRRLLAIGRGVLGLEDGTYAFSDETHFFVSRPANTEGSVVVIGESRDGGTTISVPVDAEVYGLLAARAQYGKGARSLFAIVDGKSQGFRFSGDPVLRERYSDGTWFGLAVLLRYHHEGARRIETA